ncbi:unnamed protein product [Prunus armeniaca]|nr:hypothetical protein GBA52_008281 [Prunus armeniaca]
MDSKRKESKAAGDEQGKVKWNSKEESCQLKVSRFSLVIDLGKLQQTNDNKGICGSTSLAKKNPRVTQLTRRSSVAAHAKAKLVQ